MTVERVIYFSILGGNIGQAKQIKNLITLSLFKRLLNKYCILY